MAKQVKKTSKPSSKQKVRPKKGSASRVKKSIVIVLSVFLMISLVSFGYYLGQNEESTTEKKQHTTLPKEFQRDVIQPPKKHSPEKKMQKENRSSSNPSVKTREKKSVQPEYKRGSQSDIKEPVLLPKHQKPKLVIIIDDVSSQTQLRHIQAVSLKLTPSIFPPFSLSPANHKLAKGLRHYMIHLPMESGKRYDKHTKTLMTTDGVDVIQARVREIRRLFPKATFVNNHTGSRFTKDYSAMERLYLALMEEGFIFVDSRTTAKSKVPELAKKYGNPYLSRDVFIDNDQNIVSIHRQLRQAVSIAKRRGYAVAIGHPYSITFKALAQAGRMLKDVEVVYIDELYNKEL